MKKTKKIQIVLLVILAVVIYSLPVVGILFLNKLDEESTKFEVKEDIVDIGNGNMTISNVESFYQEEDEIYYVVGYLKNETDKDYESISLTYRFYDENGIILGDAETYVSNLNEQDTWKFKVLFSEIDADLVKTYELIAVKYYR
jgi:hypothetical protein